MSTSPIGDEILRKCLECSRQNYKLEVVFIHPVDLASLLIDIIDSKMLVVMQRKIFLWNIEEK